MPPVLDQFTPELAAMAAKMVHAFLECSDGVQIAVREMIEVVNSPDSDEDERQMALNTISEALFPLHHKGTLGLGLEEADELATENQSDGRAAADDLDRQEQAFADRLRELMGRKQVTQEELARRTGVGQPAVSMMLTRQCRPQRRTVSKFAEALGVTPDDLWQADL